MKTKIPAVENLTIGLDLGDRRHTVCVLNEAGDIVTEETLVNTREVLTAFCARYPGATIVMETGTHSPWISRLVAALGHPVIVANARKVRAISQSQTKSDREDARMLARLGRADPQLLSPVRHRSEAPQRALVRLKVREALVRSLGPFGPPCALRTGPTSVSNRGCFPAIKPRQRQAALFCFPHETSRRSNTLPDWRPLCLGPGPNAERQSLHGHEGQGLRQGIGDL